MKYLIIFMLLFNLKLIHAADTSGDSGEKKEVYNNIEQDSNLLKKAKLEISSENFPRAIEFLEEELINSPNDADVWNLIGYSSRKMGNYEKAMKSYNKALYLDPSHKGALEYKGELFLQLGNVENAEKLLNKLNELCNFNCTERDLLRSSIQNYKLKN